MAEPTWNGFLRLSLVSCRVYLSPATSDRRRVHLEPLNPRTGNPVMPGFVDARTGDLVPSETAVQAHQFENGRFISVSEAELRGLAGPPSQVIDIDNFIPQGSIDRLFFEAHYYVYPDEPLGGDTLFTLRTAMLRQGQAGLGHMYVGGRQRRILVEPRGAGLMLTVLRSADQLEDVEFEARADTDVPVELIEVAESLIARRSTSVDPGSFGDAYHEGLRSLVADKVRAAQGTPAPSAPMAPAPVSAVEPPATSSYSTAPPPAVARDSDAVRSALGGGEPAAAVAMPPLSEPHADRADTGAGEPAVAAYAAESAPPSYATEAAVPAYTAEPPEPEPPSYTAASEARAYAAEPPEPELPHAYAAAPPAYAAEPPEEPELPHAYAAEPPAYAAEPAASEAPPSQAAAAATDHADSAAAAAAAMAAEAAGAEHEVGSEIFLHIIGLGERRYVGSGWAGTPGSRQPIEALSIRPAEALPRSAIEFRVFARDGRATSWVTDGNYAGSWGRRLPLTGFAVRPTEEHGNEVEIVYEGYFSEGGVVGPKRDGEVCQSAIADDPLEAVLVRILGRAG